MTEPNSPEILLEEALRGGQGFARVLRRGQTLRLRDVEGGATVAALFFNADDHNERYNMPDTLKAQHIARLTAGNVLYSDMGRVLCSITHDTVGWHDTITGHGTAAHNLKRFGPGTYQALRNDFYRNSRDNLLVELGKYELGLRDIGANVNFFVKVVVDLEGRMTWVNQARAGGEVVLRAELNTLVVLSNTPHPLDPGAAYAPKPVSLSIASGAPAGPEDPCRLSRPENARGFALTEAYFV